MPMLIINISTPCDHKLRLELRLSGHQEAFTVFLKRWQSRVTLLGFGCHGKPDEALFVPNMKVAYSIPNCFSSHSQCFIDLNKMIRINHLPCATQMLIRIQIYHHAL